MDPTEYRAKHPDFPWLEPGGVETVARLCTEQRWLAPSEQVVSCEKAGEGNMNLTLRVRTTARSLILKQARPWVEKYPQIAAPWDRSLVEQRFYERVAAVPELASGMPRLLGAASEARALLLEDLSPATDFGSVYTGGALADHELGALVRWLARLHGATRGADLSAFANREMRALNHFHMFVFPLDPANGLPLDTWEPGLAAAARACCDDRALRDQVAQAAERYLEDGPCLVHGDFFPGSWLRTSAGPRVIDPEFCFPGAPEFDLGVTAAHIALAARPRSQFEHLLASYGRPVDVQTIGRNAGIEVLRRLIGVAQLPLGVRPPGRVELLARARRAIVTGELAALF